MKILVTGGTGVIGAAAIPALLRAGHAVRLLARHADRDAPAFPEGVEPFAADIADPRPLPSAVAGCECVLHVAGIVDEEPPEITFEQSNVEGTRNLLAAATAAGAPYFVYVSSLGAERGGSEYHRSKRRAEELVRGYAGPWLILRPGSVYGPGDETISLLLKMVRGLPAVPIVDAGDQPFQPMWYADFAAALAQAVADRSLAGETLELAGPDVTTTNEVLERLAVITGRNPPRVPVPAWLAQVGTQALEAFGAAGKKLLRGGGIEAPLNAAKLSMLLEGSFIADPAHNALVARFKIEPTSVQEGLEMLADLTPELLPGEGVGGLRHATYSTEIRGSKYTAAQLIERVCANIAEVMPMEFAAEPGAPTQARQGTTLTAGINGRGHVQVRLVERTEHRVTFVTLEGHPLAGVMQLHAEDVPGALKFSVHTVSQPANAFDWVAMKLLGDSMQARNWAAVVRRVAKLSGGHAPGTVQRARHPVKSREQHDLAAWLERLVQKDRRERAAAG